MIRNLKALGLAIFALFAISAVAASAASAATGMLTSTGPVTLTGTETGTEANRVTAFGVSIECPGSTGTGHKYTLPSETTMEEETSGIHHLFIPSGASTFTITPHIKQVNAAGEANCKGPVGVRATTDFNGCDYVVHTGETTGGVAGTYGGSMDIVCPVGKDITWTVWLSKTAHINEPNNPKCIFHIPAQTGLKGVHATDTGNGTIDLTGTLEGITITQVRNSLLCPEGTHESNAKFDTDLAVTGHNEEGAATGISLSHN